MRVSDCQNYLPKVVVSFLMFKSRNQVQQLLRTPLVQEFSAGFNGLPASNNKWKLE